MAHVLIMAGGQSSRMKESTGRNMHKAMETVFDIPLIELNLLYAYLNGFDQIWISVSAKETALINFVEALQVLYEEKLPIKIRLIVEKTPLGSIGAVQFVECNEEPVLILFADNLSSLDLKALFASFLYSKAHITVASHEESFNMPFGRLVVNENVITDYLEKPEYKFLISSGYYVIGHEIQKFIRNNYAAERIEMHELIKGLLRLDFTIHSYFHNATWFDINDNSMLMKTRGIQKWPLVDEICKLKSAIVK